LSHSGVAMSDLIRSSTANVPPRIYEGLASAFLAEGVDTQFCLLGDGNMHWSTAMMHAPGMKTYHARHEHCAVAMAMGYHSATGKIGVASVTCGPGFTQVMTALTAAVRSRVPLVIFAGEVPLGAHWHSQMTDHHAFAAACGAHYIAARSPRLMHQYVRDAFFVARHERRPVVIGVPYDLQQQRMPDIAPYEQSALALPPVPCPIPDPQTMADIMERLLAARCPILVAGRGVLHAGAVDLVEKLADKVGALLGTTLLGRGMYDHHPFSVGVVGGFGRDIAREVGREADLVVAIGASLSHHTLDGGRMFPKAHMVQIDNEPRGIWHGRRVADSYVRADARLAVEHVIGQFDKARTPMAAIRSADLARRIRDEPADRAEFAVEPGTLDPRQVFAELEKWLPKDYDIVPGDGHQSYFHTVMRGGDPAKYHSMTGFGAIGSDIAYAIGIAAARGTGRVVLFEGDGSLLMHIQELELIKRQKLKLLIVCSNDGAYGSEIHKLRADGMDDSGAIFGRTDLAAIARGFGLRGETITDVSQIGPLMRSYEQHGDAELWNVHMSDKVVSPMMRATLEARNEEKVST